MGSDAQLVPPGGSKYYYSSSTALYEHFYDDLNKPSKLGRIELIFGL